MRLGKGRVSQTSVGVRCSKSQCNWLAIVPLAQQQDRQACTGPPTEADACYRRRLTVAGAKLGI